MQYRLSEQDRAVAARLLGELPDQILDAHAHLYEFSQVDFTAAPAMRLLAEDGDLSDWGAFWQDVLGQKIKGGVFFGFPVFPAGDLITQIERANQFIFSETAGVRRAKRLMLISPLQDPAQVETMLQRQQFHGLKPYLTLSPASIKYGTVESYLPDWACELAHHYKLPVTVHLGKRKALNDDENLASIDRICGAWPDLTVILAHGGCAFNQYDFADGIRRLKRQENIYFDLAYLCEPAPISILLQSWGAGRLLWGSDFPVCVRYGREITLGDNNFLVQAATCTMPSQTAIHLALENLRAVLLGCELSGVSADQRERLFYRNTADLFHL